MVEEEAEEAVGQAPAPEVVGPVVVEVVVVVLVAARDPVEADRAARVAVVGRETVLADQAGVAVLPVRPVGLAR